MNATTGRQRTRAQGQLQPPDNHLVRYKNLTRHWVSSIERRWVKSRERQSRAWAKVVRDNNITIE